MKNIFLIAFLMLPISNGNALSPALEVNDLFYCPEELVQTRQKLRFFINKDEDIIQTLFEKSFPPDAEKTCEYDVQAILLNEYDENDWQVKWRDNNTHSMIRFVFQFWNEDMTVDEYRKSIEKYNLVKPMPKLRYSTIYPICIDTSINRVIWTKYEITEFQNIDNTYIHVSNKISTKPFCFTDKDYFSEMEESFKNYNKYHNHEFTKMIIQKLTPDEHLSPIQRSATNHYVNVAALWDELEKLMKAINDGTRKVNYKIKSEPAKVGADGKIISHVFTIYTKVFYSEKSFARGTFLRIPYVWCKFLHYKTSKKGLLIYVHNTPYKVPQEEDKQCENGKRVNCNFSAWIDDGSNVINQEYAYCCDPVDSEIVKYFGLEEEVEGVLDIATYLHTE